MMQRPRILSLYICIMLFLSAVTISAAQATEKQGETAPVSVAGEQPVKQMKKAKPLAPKDTIPPKNKHNDPIKLKSKSAYCIECHRDDTPGIFEEWVKSTHARVGVGCADCHASEAAGKDTFLHASRFHISTIVTPFRCAKCHRDVYRDYAISGHAKALKLLTEMKEKDPRYPVVSRYQEDNFAQCGGCHGVEVALDEGNRPDPATWPNSSAGRMNPDESFGNCASCHLGHRFSAAAARQPETCTRCHDGPNYPEGDIYRNSVHGVVYATQTDKRALDKFGIYFDGKDMVSPTCAFCHFNGSGHGLWIRHNGAWRVPRDLTSPGAPLASRAENLRNNMKSVCNQCHASTVIDRFFENADAELEAYQKNVVGPKLGDYLKKLKKAKGEKREKLLGEYSDFLAEGKRYRMGLYMGGHGRTQR